MNVDQERLRVDLETNGSFGAVETTDGRGRTLFTGSESDRQAREYFVERVEAAGLDVRVDRVGNIAGRWTPVGCDPATAPVAVGSHLDSVDTGGIFDGPLGVYGALEAVRSIRESDANVGRPLEVVCFTEEEGGRFGRGTLGSSVATGRYSAADALELVDDDGISLADRLRDIGFAGEDTIDASGWDGWLELHIEQDTRLVEANATVGVVDSITGIANATVTIDGEANHAGSTAMRDRTDAFCAAAAFVLDLERLATEHARESGTTVGTAGELTVEPNARNIVPGEARLELDIRDVDHDRMDDVVSGCRSSLARLERERGVVTELDRYRDVPPTPLSPSCIAAVETAVEDCDVSAIGLHSAAMHDTANVADVTDAGLVFAPSVGGVSHSPQEWTDWSDCATATRILADAVRVLASS